MARLKLRKDQAGDTLVEVLMATLFLTLVLGAAYTLSNRAASLNRQSYERAVAVGLLQEQVELVRSARDAYNPADTGSQLWTDITGNSVNDVPDLANDCSDFSTLLTNRNVNSDPFYISSASTPQVEPNINEGVQTLYSVWLEIQDSTDSDYYDVHAFACWEGLSAAPVNVASIVLRVAAPI